MSIKHGSWKWLLCQNFKLMSASTIASVTFESNPSKPSLYIKINRIHKSRVVCTQKKKKSVAKNEITTKPNLQHTNSRNRGQSKSAFSVSIIFLKDLSLSLASTRLYYYSPNPLSHSSLSLSLSVENCTWPVIHTLTPTPFHFRQVRLSLSHCISNNEVNGCNLVLISGLFLFFFCLIFQTVTPKIFSTKL